MPATEVRVVFHIQDDAGAPIGGALLDAGVWRAITQQNGDCVTQLTPGHYDLTITALGFVPDHLPVEIQDPGTITRALARVGGSAATGFSIRGRDFINAAGQRIVLSGTDQYMALRQHLDGVSLAPAIAETHQLGFTMWRVFLQGSIAQNQVMDLRPTEPTYYDRLASLVALLNGEGITLLATIGVDNQDVRSPIDHWVKVGQILQGTNSIISNFNEWTKNHGDIDPAAIPAPNHPFWSRGSDQSNGAPFKPSGPVLEFHPVRNYTTAMRDAVASPIELYEVQGYTAPLLIDEPGRMGTNPHDARFSDPVEVHRYARLISTLCAGCVMHNWFGQRGLLMDALTRDCAGAFLEGMQL